MQISLYHLIKIKQENMKHLLLKLSLIAIIIIGCSSSQAQMFWNQAGVFAGNTGSYLASRNTTSVNLTGSFTLEAWINPSSVSGNKSIISKGTNPGYGLNLSSGRPAVFTNNIFRLIAKPTSVLPVNQWTHVAATYNSANNKFEMYINGLLDTSSTVNAPPLANTDSIYVGKFNTVTYAGMLDEIRIWNKALTGAEIQKYFRTSLAINPVGSLTYAGLVYSITFQGMNSGLNLTSTFDWTFSSNPVINNNVDFADMTHKLYTSIFNNESLQFDGTGDYAAAPTNAVTQINGAFTMEAWVYLKEYNPGFNQRIIRKHDGTNGFSMSINSSSRLSVVINGTGTGLSSTFPLRRWVHVAFTHSSTGASKIFLDGVSQTSPAYPVLVSNTDSTYIGGLPTGEGFNGFIDEVRISDYEKTPQQVKELMYTSIDRSNMPGGTSNDIVWNFDGNTITNSEGNLTMYLRGNAKFSHPGATDNTPISPMHRLPNNQNYPKGFRMKTANKRIPATGTSGLAFDSLAVNSNTAINDVNVFLAINHSYDGDIEATLFAPNGDSARLCFDRNTINSSVGDIITIFDDQADSSLINGRYTAFAPEIKPEDNLNTIFGGDNPFGIWRLKINDDASGDTGMVYAWGIQLNSNSLVSTGEINSNIPAKYELFQNYPNPFNPETSIKFHLPQSGAVKLKVFDILGKEVAVLLSEVKQAGAYEVKFNGAGLSSGVYFYKLETEMFTDVKRMLLVK
jgi:subtilisin-like proprotein convertase family protein